MSPQYFVLDSKTPALCLLLVCGVFFVCVFLLFCSMRFYFPALLNAACMCIQNSSAESSPN